MTQLETQSSAPITAFDGPTWKTTWMILGGLLGSVLGVIAVYLYVRTVESEHGEAAAAARPAIKPSAALQVALAVLTTVRQFANLGVVERK